MIIDAFNCVANQHETEKLCLKRANIIIFLRHLAVRDVQCGCVVHLTCGVLGDKKVAITL